MIKRLFPNRWARITAWTGAAVAWSVSVMAAASQPEAPAVAENTPPPETTTSTTSTTVRVTMPTLPESGLVVLRFTAVEPPPPQVITNTVTVRGSSGGGGGSAPKPPTTTIPSKGS
ncbi:MAG: hypothetical protein GY720_12660 [bacterium]|nr:hypothetical protein [bacterium]